MLFLLVCNEKDEIHHLLANVGPLNHILSINSVKNCLQIVAFSRILAVKQVKELDNKVLRDVLSNYGILQMRRHHKLEEQFVNELHVRPCLFKMRLILIWINLLMFFIIYTTKDWSVR